MQGKIAAEFCVASAYGLGVAMYAIVDAPLELPVALYQPPSGKVN
jgi:hypothetical protein